MALHHPLTSPLRTAWDLPIDQNDLYGVAADAAARAELPPRLSRELDRSRDRIEALRLRPGGIPPPMSATLRRAMLEPALTSAQEPWPRPLLSRYARFWREGVRSDHEADLRGLMTMTSESVVAAVATGDLRWIDRAADGLMLLCELSTWCWVAHEESHARRGWVTPDPEAPVVDLGAAEVLEVLAWTDFALATVLDARVPGLRERMRHEARTRVLDPYLADRRRWWLTDVAHNWTGWIHQHLLAAALLLIDPETDRPARDAVVALSLAQLDRYLVALPQDGGIDEGISYFWNGASLLLEAVDLVVTASGGLLDREAVSRMEVIGGLLRYPQRMDLGGGWFINVADGSARPVDAGPWSVLHRWAHHLGADDVREQALSHRGTGRVPAVRPELGLGRVLSTLDDRAWVDTASGARPPMPAETWLEQTQLLVARARPGDPDGLVLAVKGGHNDEAHNHLDVGSYLVAADGSPVMIDVGRPVYTAATFSERRYEIWSMTSSWHNLPEIRGQMQGIGPDYRAHHVTVHRRPAPRPDDDAGREGLPPGSRISALDLEIAGAYPSTAGVRSYRRCAALESTGTGGTDGAVLVRITDSWELEADSTTAPGALVLNHVLAGSILDHREGLLRVRALSQADVELRWDPNLGTGTLERRALDDPLLSASWGDSIHRLRLAPATDAEGRGRFDLVVLMA